MSRRIDENQAQFNYSRQLQRYIDKELPKYEVIQLGPTPEVMLLTGADQLPITLDQAALAHAAEDRDGHNIDPKRLRFLPLNLRKPLAIFESASMPDSQVIVTNIEQDGHKVMVAVHLNRKEGKLEINSIRSLYRRPVEQYVRWAEQGLLLYLDTKKAPGWAPRLSRIQFPKIRSLLTEADLKVSQETVEVKQMTEKV